MDSIQSGLFLDLIQRGLHYKEIETHINEDGTQKHCNKPFRLLENHVCDTDTNEDNHTSDCVSLEKQEYKNVSKRENESYSGNKEGVNNKNKSLNIDPSCVRTLSRHKRQVFSCQWSPENENLLATVSGDGTSILWDTGARGSDRSYIVLEQHQGRESDVATLDWRRDGKFLATGDYTGSICIWDNKGNSIFRIQMHGDPIFSLKWDNNGEYLLSGCYDGSVALWNPHKNLIEQRWKCHKGPIFEVDWQSNTVYTTCSGDKVIYDHDIFSQQPIRSYLGHRNEINTIKWNHDKKLLASCSDDNTAKIWSQDRTSPLRDLCGHKKGVYSMDWKPIGGDSTGDLATASFDNMSKIWCLETGKCISTLSRHNGPIYSIKYSSDGKLIATGSVDKTVNIWCTNTGEIVKVFNNSSGVYDMNWNETKNILAVCSKDGNVHLIDIRL